MSDVTNGAGVPGSEPTAPTAAEAAPVVTPSPVVAAAPATAGGTRRVGKVRNPWAVWIFSIITLGIYFLYWYFKVNSEVKEYNPSIEVSPGIATLAQIIPIANIISFWNFGGRLNKVEEHAGSSSRTSPLAGLLLQIFILGTGVVYYQMQLNKVWALHGNQPEGTLV
jgi:hypothetical protein